MNYSAPIMQQFIQSVNRVGATGSFDATWIGKFNRVACAVPVSMTLSSQLVTLPDAEIIIRNPAATSVESLTLVAGGVTLNVSGDLGLVIPPGGVGELKRDGATNVWDFYGYIEA